MTKVSSKKKSPTLRSVQALKMKPIPNLNVDLPGIGVVRAAKGQAVIEQEPPVSQVQRCHRDGQVLGD